MFREIFGAHFIVVLSTAVKAMNGERGSKQQLPSFGMLAFIDDESRPGVN